MKNILFTILFLTALPVSGANRLEIIKLGHPDLRAEALEVDYSSISDPKFQKLIDDMIFTMKKAGGVGLAAPQVNESIRMFVMQSGFRVPLTIVINPKIQYIEEDGKKNSSEGCLSIPGKTLMVKRYKKIMISYFDRAGKYISKEMSGFGAVIAQHEYDHLNGVLIIDLIEQMNELMNYSGFTDAPLM